MAYRKWTREELIVAFNLYLKLPFGKFHQHNPNIINLANLIDRTPSAVAMRLSNFANIDPYHQNRGVKGLSGGKNQCQPIWDEFSENNQELLFESEKILAKYENKSLENKFNNVLHDLTDLKGETKIRAIKTRINQNIFRQIVLANYQYKCAISGIDIPELLVASHIIPWSINQQERINPENGICLSPLYDKAYDKGYIGINKNKAILVSQALKSNSEKKYFQRFFSHLENNKINLPYKYLPKIEFLEYHLDIIYKG